MTNCVLINLFLEEYLVGVTYWMLDRNYDFGKEVNSVISNYAQVGKLFFTYTTGFVCISTQTLNMNKNILILSLTYVILMP